MEKLGLPLIARKKILMANGTDLGTTLVNVNKTCNELLNMCNLVLNNNNLVKGITETIVTTVKSLGKKLDLIVFF